MGTNYYGIIIPAESKKQELYDAVRKDMFEDVTRLYSEMYKPVEYDSVEGRFTGGRVHLGKKSYGWKFLWNPNIWRYTKGHTEDGRYVVDDRDAFARLYEPTREGVRRFVTRDDIVVTDEYGQVQDKEAFLAMGFSPEGVSYDSQEVFKSDRGDFLERLGYKLSYNRTDFESDGLRFSVWEDFS